MLRGEVKTLAIKVTRLTSVCAWTAQLPNDVVVRRVDVVKCAGVASRNQIIACARGFLDRVDVAVTC